MDVNETDTGICNFAIGILYGMFFFMLSIITVLFPLLYLIGQWLKRRTRERFSSFWIAAPTESPPVVVGFFHPYCNAGGGGERVLWCGIRALQSRYNFVHCVIYTGDLEHTPEEIMQRATERFNIELERPVTFIYLKKRRWVEADMWPYFTLLGQSIGSMLLGLEALWKFVPDVYIDTMGYAFTYPIFKLVGGCKVGCYVHYPTISTDMLMKVKSREAAYNNAAVISKSFILTHGKLLYYKLFAFVYGMVGRCASVIMVNSSWTLNHILELWRHPSSTNIVFPPCDTTEFAKLENISENEKIKRVVSIGQFRPEKNHRLQIIAFYKFLNTKEATNRNVYRLSLVGSCRNKEDEERVAVLMELCEELDITDYVEFHLNIPFIELKELLSLSTIGIHTMWNEHFGIGVVEFMAAGVIVLANDSGGPKLDIVTEWNGHKIGFLASDESGYSESIDEIFSKSIKEREDLRHYARQAVQQRFSEEIFETDFVKHTEILLR